MSKSIEELLSLVKSRPEGKRKEKCDNRDVLDFINDLGIESGTQAVPNYLIFYVYRMIWKTEAMSRKAKKITFFQTFGKHLPDYRHGKQRFYMIKEGIFNVDEELLKAARTYDKQHWQKKAASKKIPASEQERS
jgi:hypothetical protein